MIFREEYQVKEKKYEQVIHDMTENTQSMQQDLDVLHDYSKQLDDQRIEEKDQKLKLQEEIIEQTQTHEAEVRLRMQFESKLNSMH